MALLISAESGSPITLSRLAQAWAPWSLLDTTLNLASVIDWEEERAGAFGTTLVGGNRSGWWRPSPPGTCPR